MSSSIANNKDEVNPLAYFYFIGYGFKIFEWQLRWDILLNNMGDNPLSWSHFDSMVYFNYRRLPWCGAQSIYSDHLAKIKDSIANIICNKKYSINAINLNHELKKLSCSMDRIRDAYFKARIYLDKVNDLMENAKKILSFQNLAEIEIENPPLDKNMALRSFNLGYYVHRLLYCPFIVDHEIMLMQQAAMRSDFKDIPEGLLQDTPIAKKMFGFSETVTTTTIEQIVAGMNICCKIPNLSCDFSIRREQVNDMHLLFSNCLSHYDQKLNADKKSRLRGKQLHEMMQYIKSFKIETTDEEIVAKLVEKNYRKYTRSYVNKVRNKKS